MELQDIVERGEIWKVSDVLHSDPVDESDGPFLRRHHRRGTTGAIQLDPACVGCKEVMRRLFDSGVKVRAK